jgi:hypothetical protein
MINPFKGIREEREKTRKSREGHEHQRKGKAGDNMAERTYIIHGKRVKNVTKDRSKHHDFEIK